MRPCVAIWQGRLRTQVGREACGGRSKFSPFRTLVMLMPDPQAALLAKISEPANICKRSGVLDSTYDDALDCRSPKLR